MSAATAVGWDGHGIVVELSFEFLKRRIGGLLANNFGENRVWVSVVSRQVRHLAVLKFHRIIGEWRLY